MRQSFPGLIANAADAMGEDPEGFGAALATLNEQLLLLRDRTARGDVGAVGEFFDVFVFGDEPSGRPTRFRQHLPGLLRNVKRAMRGHLRGTLAFSLGTLESNLRELRDRVARDDLAALDEFFALYSFDDGVVYVREASSAAS